MSLPTACMVPERRRVRLQPLFSRPPRRARLAFGLLMSLAMTACASWPWAEPLPPAPAQSSRVVERDLSAGAAGAVPSAAR